MRYLLLVIFSFFIISCGETTPIDTNNNPYVPTSDIIDNNISALNMLNYIRVNAGMVALSNNSYLNNSAYNHAKYLDKNHLVGHYESDQYSYFTGVKPSNRTTYVGFKSTVVSENLSVGQSSEYYSLKGLMGAIYHRFGFLDFSINTIGYGKENLTYVYNMGNSDLNTLCEGTSYEQSGSYYEEICSDKSFKIKASIYESEENKTINSNPSYVVYPYSNEVNVTTAFYDETPDPLPHYDVSGYPISIEFNENEYNMSKFSINSFIIYDDNNNVLDLAADYNDSNTILSKINDNNIIYFNDYQFAIFPKNRLEYNKHYNVEFSYIYNGESKLIKWGFTTEKLDNMITYNNTTLNLNTYTKYYIYITPKDKNDVYNRFSISCSYSSNSPSPKYEIDFFDKNTISLKVSGDNVYSCDLTLNKDQINENNINVNIN